VPAPPLSDDAASVVLHATVAAPGQYSWDDVAQRVARSVAQVEPSATHHVWQTRFPAALRKRSFVPSVPILSNAGRSDQLAACFVLAPEHRLDDIYANLAQAARVQQLSGGVGIELSQLRPRGTAIQHAGGRSPGPLAFAELFAHSAKIGGAQRTELGRGISRLDRAEEQERVLA